MSTQKLTFLDCTLRDGDYYNGWDFDADLISRYLAAMATAGVDVVEIGLQPLNNQGFKGGCAYSTDKFLGSFSTPGSLLVGVMVNASELVGARSLHDAILRLASIVE